MVYVVGTLCGVVCDLLCFEFVFCLLVLIAGRG